MAISANNPPVHPESSGRIDHLNPLRYRYVIISPAKDEEAYAERTIESVLLQTVRPVHWVIVDDGSRDRTSEIATAYAHQNPWITVERLKRDSTRDPDFAVVGAFNAGLEKLRGIDYDFLVKLDMDLSLPPDYFAKLLAHFENDKRLGIASGVYLEFWNKQWVPIAMPHYHACGASKVMRRECFEQIGGYCLETGWDTVDEIRARARNWNTRHFKEITFQHLRQEGRGIGFLRTHKKNGIAYYMTGGGLFFLLFKIPYRMVISKPVVLGGIYLLWGYLSCVFHGRKRLVTESEGRLYRALLQSRLWRRESSTETMRSTDRTPN